MHVSDTSLGIPPALSAADLHHLLTEHARTQSRSGSGRLINEEAITTDTATATANGSEQDTLFSILHGHGHHICTAPSPNQPQQIQGASFRALRSQCSASNSSLPAKARNGAIRVLGLEQSLSLPWVAQQRKYGSRWYGCG
jgi:hypothetical protein